MKQIRLSEYGIFPGDDCAEKINALLSENPEDCEFIFEPGDYIISSVIRRPLALSNTNAIPARNLGILMENMKNIRLTGCKTRILCAGRMQPLTLLCCENTVVSGFLVDWEKPMAAEGIVTGFSDTSVDLYIDPHAFPHRILDGEILFDIGNGEEARPADGVIQYDACTRTIRRTTGDRFGIGALQKELGGYVYRFDAFNVDTAGGNVVVLRHNRREHAGIFAEKCRNVTFENIEMQSCGGLGCLCQFCDTLTFRNVNYLPNRNAGRTVVNGRDDGMHITCCSGTVTVENCSFLGLMDDPINVHGCCVPVIEWTDGKTVRCRYGHNQSFGFNFWAEKGDEIAFIDRNSLQKIGTGIAESFFAEDEQTFVLTFKSAPAENVRFADPASVAIDNLSHTAAFICRNNRFGSCRARGVLISTPKPVKIQNNYFESSGSAILVAGDANGWFESGACHDVEISGNVFTDSCLSSMFQFCEGIISICPVVPMPSADKPFHSNIRIHGNIFDTPGVPVLYGFSCDGLSFTENRIYRSPRDEGWHPRKDPIRLEYCKNVKIDKNVWTGPFKEEKVSCDGATVDFV